MSLLGQQSYCSARAGLLWVCGLSQALWSDARLSQRSLSGPPPHSHLHLCCFLASKRFPPSETDILGKSRHHSLLRTFKANVVKQSEQLNEKWNCFVLFCHGASAINHWWFGHWVLTFCDPHTQNRQTTKTAARFYCVIFLFFQHDKGEKIRRVVFCCLSLSASLLLHIGLSWQRFSWRWSGHLHSNPPWQTPPLRLVSWTFNPAGLSSEKWFLYW